MRSNKFLLPLLIASVAAFLLLAGCTVNVKKEANGQDKQVDINTLLGGIHVRKDADAADIGLDIYPGARLKQKDKDNDNDKDGSDKSANVRISGFGYGLRVVALEYESDDAPANILAFYKDRLKKYGNVIECHTSKGNWNVTTQRHGSNELTCEGSGGSDIELKVGKQDDQHIVAVKSEGKGSTFSLVYVRTHGKDADI
jgi:hypothetical protein